MQEPRLFKGGEVEFRLRPNRDTPPEAYGSPAKRRQRARDQAEGLGGLLLIGLIIAFIAWLASSCGRSDGLVSVKTSDGKVLRVTPQEAASMYVAGGDVPWDFTKIKNPKEPADIFPDSAPTPRPNK